MEVVYPTCGSHNGATPLTIQELEWITNYPVWIDVCRKIKEEL